MYKMSVVSRGNYDDRGYSNEESIAHLQLQKPVEINAFLTYNYGMDDDRFPLSFMTEGQGKGGVVECENIEWTWKTMGRMKFTDCVTYFNTANTSPGKGGAEIEVHFATHRFIEQYGLIGPDGVTQLRIQKDLGETAFGFGYLLKPTGSNPSAVIDPALFTIGKYWSLSAPTVSESYSRGNRSNTMGPGTMKSQLEIQRYSKEIGGNLANVVTQYEFKNGTGATSKLWINEEMRQFNLQMRIMNEERLWIAEYNRNVNGEILLTDRDNGKPIPHTAGMLEIAKEANYDTYGEFLTLNKIKRTVGDVLDRESDDGMMNIILIGGKGFVEDFDDMVKRECSDSGFLTPLGDKMINEIPGGLSFGNYFRQYKTIEGHLITVKRGAYFDKGTIAEAAKQNGLIHPRTGLPITSHQAVFIDFSTYEGTQNVRLARQKGQVYKAKVLKGMTDIPASWGVPESNYIATEIDKSEFHIKSTLGLQINKSNKMFYLKCVL